MLHFFIIMYYLKIFEDIYLFIYLNIFIQDIKHNSARLLYVVLLYNKTMCA